MSQPAQLRWIIAVLDARTIALGRTGEEFYRIHMIIYSVEDSCARERKCSQPREDKAKTFASYPLLATAPRVSSL